MSPITRLAWWWLRTRGWAIQLNDPPYQDPQHGWRPYFSVRHGKTPVYRIGPTRATRAARRRWANIPVIR